LFLGHHLFCIIKIRRSNTPPIEASTSSASRIERPLSPPITTEASSPSPDSSSSSAPSSSTSEIERPVSPTGSTDSSETVTNLSYTDAKGKQKVILPRRD